MCVHVHTCFLLHFFSWRCCPDVCLPGRCARCHPTLPLSLCSEFDKNPGRLPGSAHSWELAMSSYLQRSENRRLAPHTPPVTPLTPASKATPELLMLPKYQMSCWVQLWTLSYGFDVLFFGVFFFSFLLFLPHSFHEVKAPGCILRCKYIRQ